MLFAVLYYVFSARKWFKGPKINVEHIIHGVTLDGEGSVSGSGEHVAEKPLEIGI
jgi:hypothetical protein